MAIGHFHMTPVSRSKDRSATAAAAYRACVLIADRQTGEVHDYRQKMGCSYSKILLPGGTTMDRSDLWNLAEAAERRINSVVAREIVVALPHELDPEPSQELTHSFSRYLAERHRIAIDACIHEAQGLDERNRHAHILLTTRTIEMDETGAPRLGRKTRDLDERRTGRLIIKEWRREWEKLTNETLERSSIAARIDMRSLKDRGEDREPNLHRGRKLTAAMRAEQRARAETRGLILDDCFTYKPERLQETKELTLHARRARRRRERARVKPDWLGNLRTIRQEKLRGGVSAVTPAGEKVDRLSPQNQSGGSSPLPFAAAPLPQSPYEQMLQREAHLRAVAKATAVAEPYPQTRRKLGLIVEAGVEREGDQGSMVPDRPPTLSLAAHQDNAKAAAAPVKAPGATIRDVQSISAAPKLNAPQAGLPKQAALEISAASKPVRSSADFRPPSAAHEALPDIVAPADVEPAQSHTAGSPTQAEQIAATLASGQGQLVERTKQDPLRQIAKSFTQSVPSSGQQVRATGPHRSPAEGSEVEAPKSEIPSRQPPQASLKDLAETPGDGAGREAKKPDLSPFNPLRNRHNRPREPWIGRAALTYLLADLKGNSALRAAMVRVFAASQGELDAGSTLADRIILWVRDPKSEEDVDKLIEKFGDRTIGLAQVEEVIAQIEHAKRERLKRSAATERPEDKDRGR